MTHKIPPPLSTVLLLGANAVPLLGVIFLGWNLFSIMVLYWAENGLIWPHQHPQDTLRLERDHVPHYSGRRLVRHIHVPGHGVHRGEATHDPFFVFHYGLFWAVHGVFIFALFGPARGPTVTVALGVLVLFASHAASFLVNYVGHHEYLKTSPYQQMSQPYSRIIVLHVAILGGGFLTLLLGAPVAALAVLVAVKTVIDLRAHTREHAKAAATNPV